MSVDQFLSIGFINKKVQQYRKSMDKKDLKNLFNLFEENQSLNNKKKSKQSLHQLSKQPNFLRVAKQVQLLGHDNDYCMVFGIYSMKIENANKDYLTLILERIIEESCFDGQENQNDSNHSENKKTKASGVALIFFNSHGKKRFMHQNGKKISQPLKFDDFKNQIIKNLRFKHLSKINHVILLHPSFCNRSWNFLSSFGFRDGFYGNFITLFESVSSAATFLGPLFEYGKIDLEFLTKEETEKINSSVYSLQQITKSKQQFTFYQQFESPLDDETRSLFVYLSQVKDYHRDPETGIPLLLQVCFKYLLRNHIRFQGLFRKVGDQTDLRKLQNKLWIYQSDSPFNKQSQYHEMIQIKQQINRELSLFPPETITSFVKKVFTNLQHPLFAHQVYRSIVSLSWIQLQSMLTCIQQNQSIKDQQLTKIDFTEIHQSVSVQTRKIIQEKINVKRNIAFFENLSPLNINSLSPQSSFINSTLMVDRNDFRKQNKISFTKIPNPNQLSKTSQQKLKNVDFLQLKEIQNYSTDQFLLLKETIFFLNKITSQRKFNFMSAKNLAICFNPCFFRTSSLSKKENSCQIQQQLQNQSKLVRVIEKIIENPEFFFEIE